MSEPLSPREAVSGFPLVDTCHRCGDDTHLAFPSALPNAPDFGEYECSSCGHTQVADLLAVLISMGAEMLLSEIGPNDEMGSLAPGEYVVIRKDALEGSE